MTEIPIRPLEGWNSKKEYGMKYIFQFRPILRGKKLKIASKTNSVTNKLRNFGKS